MDVNTLDFQQARIKQILFKSQLRSVLYGVREADEALFAPQGNALGQWLSSVIKPKFPLRPEVREAERLLHDMLGTGRELAAQYRRGQIDEARRGLTRIDRIGEQLVSVLHKLGQEAGRFGAAA
ncbi:hypothetical protein AUC43_18500 [Hymenobacter sedentarius]|uniref:Uncharacterized protein n=1 Tax=Hymenobacter sedentarius TaxID=1411621 RepID=A0A0U4B1G1_9BACT|nr:CZB domain-containing protein [Hymenobacter sedentarius]ALW86893.1 hypothetical protein AUC43_18500 [Hymenobacter sedentarius]